jgi:HK97 family phage major capsid protein
MANFNAEAQTIRAKADTEGRDLTIEEETQLDNCLEGFAKTRTRLDQLKTMEDQADLLKQPAGRKTTADEPRQELAAPPGEYDHALAITHKPKAVSKSGNYQGFNRGTGGYDTFGHFAGAVARACQQGGMPDQQLATAHALAATTYGNEAIGADGGFAVPPDFRSTIMSTVLAEDSLAGMCDQIPVSGNTFTCPVDETTPWQTSGGILAYWDGEGSTATQSKPSLQDRTVKLNKVRCLVPMTDELMGDVSSMDAYLRRKAPEKISFKLTLAIVQGTGVGQPLGFINSPSLISVTKNNPQTADTITGKNIIDMYSRMYSRSLSNSVWLINPNVLPQLLKLSTAGTDDAGNAVTGWGSLTYMPPNGLSQSPYGTLMGRPVIHTEACETLGDLGDILFVDLKQYMLLIKSGTNPRIETSMHLWFDQDMTAFKFVLRVGGQPWWSTTMSGRDGTPTTYSPFVGLEAR